MNPPRDGRFSSWGKTVGLGEKRGESVGMCSIRSGLIGQLGRGMARLLVSRSVFRIIVADSHRVPVIHEGLISFTICCDAGQAMGAATPCTTAWEEVGLSNLRQGLDEQAMTIAENQESSLQSRKALATQAKSFRVALEEELEADSEIRASSGSLVRIASSRLCISRKPCMHAQRRPRREQER